MRTTFNIRLLEQLEFVIDKKTKVLVAQMQQENCLKLLLGNLAQECNKSLIKKKLFKFFQYFGIFYCKYGLVNVLANKTGGESKIKVLNIEVLKICLFCLLVNFAAYFMFV